MTVAFVCAVESALSAEELFDRARDIDLHVRSQERSREVAVGGVTSGLIGLGETVSWRARHFGIPFTMTSRITELDPPRRFVDEAIAGPFASFRHVHEFEPLPSGGCVMRDRVRFSAPLGPLGVIAERLVLARYLERLIRDRARFLARR